jgi:hypothetical protein
MERKQTETLRKPRARLTVFLMVIPLILALAACVPGVFLRTDPGRPDDLMKGTYTLFLYGCSYPHRIENAVILAPEGGRYPFEIYGPAFEYKVKTGVPAEAAFKEGEQFLQCSTYYRKSQLRRVLDPEGNTIGYELRPLYSPIDFGRDDVLTIMHKLTKDNKVLVFIRLDRDIERMLSDDNEPFLHDGISGK